MFGFNKNKVVHKLVTGGMLTDEEFIVREIEKFKLSNKRKTMLDGERYYRGMHDILHNKRTAVGVGGELQEVSHLPNNKIVDNQYKKMVDQKSNYLLGKPMIIQSEDSEYNKLLKKFFDKKFDRIMKCIAEDSLNNGIGWLQMYYDDNNTLSCKRIPPTQIIAGWKDSGHTELDYVIRIYDVVGYEGKREVTIEKVEVYDSVGVHYFELKGGKLVGIEPFSKSYITTGDSEYNWVKIPFVAFKYNNKEIPLINMVKSLQDAINTTVSNFENNMQEDVRNTILVLSNYDGTNLSEFRKNLATYGVVKLQTVNGVSGDLKTLQVEVNAENYKSILSILKKALIENAMGYDAKDDRLGGNANQLNIQSMYSDIDLDASSMETEFQSAIVDVLWFLNCHYNNVGVGDYSGVSVSVMFNRDMLMNETDIINNCVSSIGILSSKTIIENHPWVSDVQLELKRMTDESARRVKG